MSDREQLIEALIEAGGKAALAWTTQREHDLLTTGDFIRGMFAAGFSALTAPGTQPCSTCGGKAWSNEGTRLQPDWVNCPDCTDGTEPAPSLLAQYATTLEPCYERVPDWTLLHLRDAEGESFTHIEMTSAVGDDYDGDELLSKEPLFRRLPEQETPKEWAEKIVKSLNPEPSGEWLAEQGEAGDG